MKHITNALVGTVVLATALCGSAQVSKPPTPRPPLAASAGSRQGDPMALGHNRTLVVSKEAVETKDLNQTEEDLNIMARILEKAVNGDEERGKHAMGIGIQTSLFGGGGIPRNMYLEGYGALFILNVSFPLLPTSSTSEETETKEEISSEWDEARQELYEAPSSGFALDFQSMITPGRFGASQPYDKGRIEKLKTDILSALKNAVHIDNLQKDEQVTIVLMGGGGFGGGAGGRKVITKSEGRSKFDVFSHMSGQGQESRMVLQVKRVDIEAFQKGSLTLEEFRKKVSIQVS